VAAIFMKSYDRDAGEVKSEFVLKMATQSRQSADPFYPKFSVFFSNFELYTAISIKVVHEQSGKVEYERERLLGIALKIH
jgi:hypothetical protein